MERLELNKMDHKIELWQSTKTDDGYGNQTLSWTKEKSLWAEIDNADRYSENRRSEGVRAENFVKFKVYYDSSIDFDKRLKLRDKFYDIVNITELGYRDGMQIIARWTA